MIDEPEVSPWFWELLAGSNRSVRAFCRQLDQLSQEQFAHLLRAFDEARGYVTPLSWEECFPYLREEPHSEGLSEDFAAWVVTQGRDFYYQVLAHPETIQRDLDTFRSLEEGAGPRQLWWDDAVERSEHRGYPRLDFISMHVYEVRFGENLYDICYDKLGNPRE